MGCSRSRPAVAASGPELNANNKSGRGRRWSAKDHHPSKTLPESPAGSTRKATADPTAQLRAYIDSYSVVIFSRSTCKRCAEVKKLFKSMCVPYFLLELDQTEDRPGLEAALSELTPEADVPVVFVKQRKIGGHGSILKAYQEGRLQKLLKMNDSEDLPESYDYDLVIIGGGSGGLAAAKEAAKYDKKVMVLDFVTPTPLGTRWGLGGTCVNVGCIPKKLMHQAALLGQALRDSRNYGWEVEETVKHDWEKMTEAVQNHIGSLNWGYRVALREKKVVYENAYGQFIGPHRIKATNNKGKEKIYSAERFLIATGERPRYLGIPGDKEYCISSDDLFSLPYCPGKTLVVGASYVALECAGFLAGIGLDVTVMVRSILLRGFDQDMANKIGEHMEEHGVKFIRQFVPIKIEQIEAGTPGRLRVVAQSTNSEETIEGEYNTVYHSYFWPLEWTVPSRDNNKCYAKVVCNIKDNERVVGFHVLGPNAGEVTQGFAAALKCGLTKKQLDNTIGIHPVCAEVFTTLSVTKRSGGSILQTGCG
uniref:Thioredoxin reductase 1, cytoplasmic n=1 Tax=Propithecus coquereli TaxID=379532 RepID=A0A2K6F185_PROCO